MPLDSTPDTAENIIKFDGTPGRAAMLNYSVPLPGHVTGRRAVLLDLGLAAGDWSAFAKNAGISIPAAIALKKVSEGQYTYDTGKAISVWLEHARASGVPGDQLDLVRKHRSRLEASFTGPAAAVTELDESPAEGGLRRQPARRAPRISYMIRGGRGFGEAPPELTPDPDGFEPEIIDLLDQYLLGLERGQILLPKGTFGGNVTVTGSLAPPQTPTPAPAQPVLMLIEVYGVSSFLGDYGLGRTVKTFTLLPGEATSISLKTWRSSEAKVAEASSIIDSFQRTAADKFRNSVQRETTDRDLVEVTESGTPGAPSPTSPPFRLDSIGIDLLFGAVKVDASGGYGTETHTTRDDFSKIVCDQVQEHANEASSKRETSVTSSSEWSEKTGEESATERTIKNVNLRRVLNFVFRELNQEYITKVHLKEVRVGFSNGKPFSYREVPLSRLRKLLQEVLVPGMVDQVAQQILKQVAVVFDVDDDPVMVLETVTMSANGLDWTSAGAQLAGNQYPPPTDTMFYRFRRGILGDQDTSPNPVEGVILDATRVTLRTDSVIVEALLGQADALDEYAMEMQRAEAEAKTLANEREKLAQEALTGISDAEERAEAFAAMFPADNEALKLELVNTNGSS
jgi:hypothetical protein